MPTAQSDLLKLAKARGKDDQIPFSEALTLVCRERPMLASEARAEALQLSMTDLGPPEKETTALGPAQAEFIQLANERARRDSIKLSEAIQLIWRERPTLANKYRLEVLDAKD